MNDIQLFRKDEDDIKNRNIWLACRDFTLNGLKEFFKDAYETLSLGEILYDEKYLKISKAIKKDVFKNIYDTIFLSFAKIGTYESLITILKSVFGQEAKITFENPAPGVLEFSVEQSAIDKVEWAVKINGQDSGDTMVIKKGDTTTNEDFIFQLSINEILMQDVIDLLDKVLKPAGMHYVINNITDK
jgi:hypothetical protein